jgi:hypothetical protein
MTYVLSSVLIRPTVNSGPSRTASVKAFLFVAAVAATFGYSVQADGPPNPFDGKSLAAWTKIDGKPVTDGWEVVDGMIHLKKDGKGSGHIITVNEFGDFTLTFEWKIAVGGNSGVKYRVRSYGNKVLGCEYQIYDDEGKKKMLPRNSAGSLYDLYEPNSSKQLKPAGEWNQAKIVVRGNSIEHWLNGQQVVAATVGDSEWKKRISESKFSEYQDFSQQPRGKLMLTDHGSEVWYRNFSFEQH